jgi:hypothetical protein
LEEWADCGLEAISHSEDAILHEGDVEVEEQAQGFVRQLEVGEQGDAVDRGYAFAGLQLDDDEVFDQEIEPVA